MRYFKPIFVLLGILTYTLLIPPTLFQAMYIYLKHGTKGFDNSMPWSQYWMDKILNLGITIYPSERIVIAAIKITNVNNHYDGIYLGLRHAPIFNDIHNKRKLLGDDNDEMRLKILHNAQQGFLTSSNRFVDRAEALKIAQKNHQIIYPYPNSIGLFSKMIY